MTKADTRQKMISFRADDETLEQLEELEADVNVPGVILKSRRSMAVRLAIETAWKLMQGRKRDKETRGKAR